MDKYTPGEWKVEMGECNPLIVAETPDGPMTVAEILDDCYPAVEQQHANARLFAASKDMLAALEGILPIAEAARHALGLDIDQRIRLDDARAAVAKAKPVDVAALEVEPWE